MYYYWIENVKTKETDEFIDDILMEPGTRIDGFDGDWLIIDVATIEEVMIGCEDLKEVW